MHRLKGQHGRAKRWGRRWDEVQVEGQVGASHECIAGHRKAFVLQIERHGFLWGGGGRIRNAVVRFGFSVESNMGGRAYLRPESCREMRDPNRSLDRDGG